MFSTCIFMFFRSFLIQRSCDPLNTWPFQTLGTSWWGPPENISDQQTIKYLTSTYLAQFLITLDELLVFGILQLVILNILPHSLDNLQTQTLSPDQRSRTTHLVSGHFVTSDNVGQLAGELHRGGVAVPLPSSGFV